MGSFLSKQQTEKGQVKEQRLIPLLPDELAIHILARLPRSSHSVMKLVSKSWNSTISSDQLVAVRRNLGLTEQWLYILLEKPHGELFCCSLDPDGVWRHLPPMPHDSLITRLFKGHLTGCSIAELDGYLYAVGGAYNSSNQYSPSVRRYDPRTNRWSSVAPMSSPRAFCSTGVVNGLLYVVGGKGNDGSTMVTGSSAEVYDPVTDKWTPVASTGLELPDGDIPGHLLTWLVVLSGRLWLAWTTARGDTYTAGNVFDPVTGTWSGMPRGMITVEAGERVGVAVEGRLLSLNREGTRVREYDVEHDCWRLLAVTEPGVFQGPGRSFCFLADWNRELHTVVRTWKNGSVTVRRVNRDGETVVVGNSCFGSDIPLAGRALGI